MSPAIVTAGSQPVAIAVSADGKSVYVANADSDGPGGISEFDVGSGGALTPKATASVAGGDRPAAIAVSPNGAGVYVTNSDTDGVGGISQYDVGAGGALSPMATVTVAAGDGPIAIAVSPDGRSVYVANVSTDGAGGVSQYDVGAGGTLTPKSNPTVPGGSQPEAIAVSPDGKSVYVANADTDGAGGVSQYDVGAGGALSPKATATVAAGDEPGAIVVLPDQGPAAAFTATAARAGSTSRFNGSASSDPDGTVVRYDWSFGDGTSALNAGPMPRHTYRSAGVYTVALQVTDGAGCSNVFVFTGRTAYCNGGPQAIAEHRITISPPDVKITQAKVNSKHHGAQFNFKALGKASGFQCALVSKPKKRRHKSAKPRFAGCKSPRDYRHLKSGSYIFEVRAVGVTGHGEPAAKSFTIA